MKSKNNNVMAILIVLIGISIFAAVLIFSLSKTSPEDGYFNPMKKSAAQKLYSELTEINEENYPQAPEEVVIDYLKGTRILYGDMIEDETVISSILRSQRLFYTQEILDSTSLEQQEENIKKDIKTLKESNVFIVECSTKPIIFYENDLNKGYVRVILEDSAGNKYYWKYYVKRDDNGFWKIEGYKRSDENFTE